MNCRKHSERPAVTSCSICNNAMCVECANETDFLKEEAGVVCTDCATKIVSNVIERWIADLAFMKKYLIIAPILYVIGIICIVAGIVIRDGGLPKLILTTAVGMFICGFYTARNGWKAGERAYAEKEQKEGVTYIWDDTGIRRKTGFWTKLLYLVMYTIVGVIVTPINIIKYAINIKPMKAKIEDAEKLREELIEF